MKDSVAKDIMTSEVISAKSSTTIEEAIKILVNYRITGLPVVDDENRLIGVLSEYDIIQSLSETVEKKGGRSRSVEVEKSWLQEKIPVPKSKLLAIAEDTPLADILEQFIKTKIRRLPVISTDRELLGVITRRDIVKLLFYRARLAE